MSAASTLFTGSGRLAMAQPHAAAPPATLSPWALLVRDGRVLWVGEPGDLPAEPDPDEVVDLGSVLVTPGLVDAHTHPLYAGDRSDEAAARLAGDPYTGGGILRTVAATRAASDGELVELARLRLDAELAAGTTAVECKSGYGLSTDEELRALRLIARAAEGLPIRVVRTFLGAHAIPAEASSASDYARTVADEMLPAVAVEGLAEFCDVFCDEGFFSLADAERVLGAARGAGLGLRVHAEQLARTGATELAVRLGAMSVDHLEQLDDAGVAVLQGSDTVATLLPAPALVMRDRLPPARALLDAGVSVALASDANAGTFRGWGQMPLVIGLGATVLGMTIDEALAAATSGGAASLGLSLERGRLAPGLVADLVAWDAEHEGAFALQLGAVRAQRVWVAGREVRPEG
ncbi:MAG: imidazolonepropionase [Chloroflexi bacterium]|nr:MAG: imidazolonepropionase [Chloroflexota bacterium]